MENELVKRWYLMMRDSVNSVGMTRIEKQTSKLVKCWYLIIRIDKQTICKNIICCTRHNAQKKKKNLSRVQNLEAVSEIVSRNFQARHPTYFSNSVSVFQHTMTQWHELLVIKKHVTRPNLSRSRFQVNDPFSHDVVWAGLDPSTWNHTFASGTSCVVCAYWHECPVAFSWQTLKSSLVLGTWMASGRV